MVLGQLKFGFNHFCRKDVSPRLTIVISVYNMQREIQRTLFSLHHEVQRGVSASDYEVIIVDNGSEHPLPLELLQQYFPGVQYCYVNDASSSPVIPFNQAVSRARGELVLCCIDGARILSPNIINYVLRASRAFQSPFIYTLGMHLGHQPQNLSMLEGYNQQVEDLLLDSISWQEDPYRLFSISSLALSSSRGFFGPLAESNAFCMTKHDFLEMGGLDERFQSPGGGLVNLDFFNLVHENPKIQPVMLLGEATFHQFHGGVATNVPMDEHPAPSMAEEYKEIRGKTFKSSWYEPCYFGRLPSEAKAYLSSATI